MFIGIFLEAASERVSQLAPPLCVKHGLRGTLRPAGIRHLTLCHIDDYDGIPAKVVEEVSRACAEACSKVAPLDIQLDHAMSFPGSRAFVLCDDGGNLDLRDFQHLLHSFLGKTKYERRGQWPLGSAS